MKHMTKNKWFSFFLIGAVMLLSGCNQLVVFDPKGPVAQSQKDLIMYSLIFMMIIVVVVFVLFAFMVYKFRDRPNRKSSDYDPDIHGNTMIEIIWTVIPLAIVIALSIPTVQTIYDLEKPSAEGTDEEPLVIYATSADWKWFFSYPEQNIETVNYLHIPTGRDIEFRLSSADSMAALWIPALGGQKYNMAGMETVLYLQADEPGVYDGRNSNFNGEGFAKQTFKVHAESKEQFEDWVQSIQIEKPALTQEQYDTLLEPGLTNTMAFSSTHLQWVDHGTNEGRDYSIERHEDAYGKLLHLENINKSNQPQEVGE
ncbi:cytochrome aa3 quinol oxidase subunit II [Alteribacillus iranensis]|uniref:Quinol oxidase subunit 2 n=1 Tax=Alteribacillus iranensis TaxID=930128 RepID=A0A1I2EBT4_9BACI|nr:cytochrome aa3 quinol oxidase subunit II [Alteribacillus iranensis]SFE90113.1 cytochrome aa3 quinol oxidase subunit 2 [Alteribacillus iranensis]